MSFQDFINYAKSKEDVVREHDKIAPELYTKHSVNKGLRDINGNGVVTGIGFLGAGIFNFSKSHKANDRPKWKFKDFN